MIKQDTSSPNNKVRKTGAFLGAIALGVTTLLLPGCTTNNNEEIREGKTNTTSEEVAAIPEDATKIIGKEVTIRSDAAQAVGKSGFVMTPQNGQPILVINATGTPFVLPTGDMPVQATGKVESLVMADVEKEYNLALEDNLYTDYERKPAIIAQSLALAPNPEDLATAPTGYFDKVIAVEGDVRKLEDTPNSFALFEEGWVDDIGVLVVGADPNLPGGPLSAIQEGENVVVTGVARKADAQMLKEANLGWDDAKINEFVSRYTNRPVIVATKIYPSAVDPAPGN
jgi:hypothetical protein